MKFGIQIAVWEPENIVFWGFITDFKLIDDLIVPENGNNVNLMFTNVISKKANVVNENFVQF